MSRTTFLLLGVTYYVISIIIIILVLNKINSKTKKKYLDTINNLERDKNLIISAGILTELNKVSNLVNTDLMQEVYDGLNNRFKKIKEVEIPKITDELIAIQELFDEKKYKELKPMLNKTELEIYFLKSKSTYLLKEIEEITLSEVKNRQKITKLKSQYRTIITTYNNNKMAYQGIENPIELQFETIDRLFSSFEVSMEEFNYHEISKIIKALDDLIQNLEMVIKEAPSILLMGTKLIPKKMNDVIKIEAKMKEEGYNLEYLNITSNVLESKKKIKEILEKLNVLNITDSSLELKTILDYFDGLYNEFDKEKKAKNLFLEYMRSILVRSNKIEKVNNELRRKTSDFKYSYDLKDEDLEVLEEIKNEIKGIKKDYTTIIEIYRSKEKSYTRLNKEMNALNTRLGNTEEKLEYAVKNLGTLKEDELRAREELERIKELLEKSKRKMKSYKIPALPKEYYVFLKEASFAINDVYKELSKNPLSIKTLNIRVDTARDLVLKVYEYSKEIVDSCRLAEESIVYGNRYRSINKNVDALLTRAEYDFYEGNFKASLEEAVNANNLVEPNYYKVLSELYKKEKGLEEE